MGTVLLFFMVKETGAERISDLPKNSQTVKSNPRI